MIISLRFFEVGNRISARLPFKVLTLWLVLCWPLLILPLPAVADPGGSAAGLKASANAGEGQSLPADIARIIGRGELVVAMNGHDDPPFFSQRDGKLQGIEVDMARELARELGVQARFDRRARSYNEVVGLVAAGEADVGISKLSRTLHRAQRVRFSRPYLSLRHALLLNRLALAHLAGDRPVPNIIRDFDASLGVIANSAYADFAAHNFPRAEIRAYPTWPEIIRDLRQGALVAAYRDEFEVRRVMLEDPTASLHLRAVTLMDLEDTLGIAVGVGDDVLLDVVNLFLEQRPMKLDIDKVLQAFKPDN